MKIGVVFIVVAFVLFVTIATSVTYFITEHNKSKNNQSDLGSEDKSIIDKENPDSSGANVSESGEIGSHNTGGGSSEGSDGGSGGGGSSDGGSEEGSGTSSCLTSIPYSLINPQEIQTCNQESNNICLNKTIKCSIEVNNNDDTIEGDFELKASFSEKDSEIVFESKTSKVFLGPGEESFVEMMTDIISSGVDGRANKELTCVINTASVPQREIC
jgi:hypothetical protein